VLHLLGLERFERPLPHGEEWQVPRLNYVNAPYRAISHQTYIASAEITYYPSKRSYPRERQRFHGRTSDLSCATCCAQLCPKSPAHSSQTCSSLISPAPCQPHWPLFLVACAALEASPPLGHCRASRPTSLTLAIPIFQPVDLSISLLRVPSSAIVHIPSRTPLSR
jgi:hypothetical protein